MTIPDWQLPQGVDRGLWDYLHADEMVAGYDEQMAASPLASTDLAFCERWFPSPGRLLDLGCGTGRLCVHFARQGYDCLGVDLSPMMLAKARENAANAGDTIRFQEANLIDLAGLAGDEFDYAACLFSTLGMIRGGENREAALRSARRVLRSGGRLVLHVHNRWYRGLGWQRLLGQGWRTLLGFPAAGDITMRQAYGGAPLTLHHFTKRETARSLTNAGFRIDVIEPIRINGATYGWMIAATAEPGTTVTGVRASQERQ